MEENIKAFLRMERELIKKYHGKIAIFSRGKLLVIEKNLERALKKARKKTKEKTLFIAELYTPEEQTTGIL